MIPIILPKKRWIEVLPVLQELRENLTEKHIHAMVSNSDRLNYEMVALTNGCETTENIAAIAGYALSPHIERGAELWIHDFVVRKELRGQGLGSQLLEFVEERARDLGCITVRLHSNNARFEAHDFYQKKGCFGQDALVFSKFVA